MACGSGHRSAVSATLLDARTGPEVINALGEMSAWKAAGYATTTDEKPAVNGQPE